MEDIRFYKVNERYGEFSSFYPSSILLLNEVWATVEHYFQARKFDDPKVWDRIKAMKSPMDAANEGRNRSNILRPDWESVKDGIMYKAVKAKFLQHPNLKRVLLETGSSQITEHTANDDYWADGGNGSGRNVLGNTLMRVRGELREIWSVPDAIFPPWISFPNATSGDMFWRMGLGEAYLEHWYQYVEDYGIEDYKKIFPENSEWAGAYQ